MFYCPNCTGKHALVADARNCKTRQQADAARAAMTAPMVTERQLSYIASLSGDASYAASLTRKAASEYIDRLKKVSPPVHDAPNRRQTKIPLEMLKGIQPGYYAMQSPGKPYRFYRVSVPKTGKYKGMMKVQSQHSEKYNIVLTVNLNTDSLYWYNMTCEEDIMILAVNQKACAVEYGQYIGRCCRCNKELTDERSRYFGIGPECEQHWPSVINMVTESKGEFVPS